MNDGHVACPRHQDFLADSVLQQGNVEQENRSLTLSRTFLRDCDGGKEAVAGVTSTQQIA